jgi:hypothetical protein
VISGLVNGTLYYFRVTAVDSGGLVSGYSNDASATPNIISLCVATTGNDGNLGTQASPLRNIQTALNRAGFGDTVKVEGGTYAELLTPGTQVVLLGGYTASFTESERDIFANKTILRPSSGTIFSDNMSCVVDGFIFDGTNVGNNACGANVLSGVTTITHNAFTRFSASGDRCLSFASDAGVIAKNNTFVDNVLSGGGAIIAAIAVPASVDPSTTIQNNIIVHGDAGISNAYNSSLLSYNCVYNNHSGNYMGDTSPGQHDISVAPRLVYPAANDFRLKGGSPCIDAGNPSDPVGEEPAPSGDRIDIGAYGGTGNATRTGWNPTTYVSTNGSDGNDGSINAPYLTIQTALTHFLGDTIKVAAGTYAEALQTVSQGRLRGGYAETFSDASRNVHQFRTTIQAIGSTMLLDNFGMDVDGFFFDGMTSVASFGIDVRATATISHDVFLNFKATSGYGVRCSAVENILNNTFYNCNYSLWIESGAVGSAIKNNIFSTNNYAFYNLAANGLTSYNDFYNSPRAGVYTDPGIGDISLNPLFRNPAALDFRLQNASPCINAGDPSSQFNDPEGTRNDMGSLYCDAPPSPPASLVAIAGVEQVTLQWTRNSEPDFLRYRIYRGTSPNPTTKVDSTTGGIADTAKTITGLVNGTTYYFRITAVDNADNESPYSTQVSGRPNGPPATPQNLAATIGNTQVTLKWNKNSDYDFLRYRIYRGTSPNPTTQTDSTTGGIADTAKIITGLTNGTIY